MTKFRFKFSVTVWVLLCAVLLLSVAGLCFNVYNIISYSGISVFKTVLYSIIVVLNAILVAFTLTFMFCGGYSVKNGRLNTYFGFIKTSIATEHVTGIIHYKKSDKLVVYYDDSKYAVALIANKSYDDFVLALRNENGKIFFDVKIDGEDTPV